MKSAKEIINVSCIFTSYFSASVIDKIGKALIENSLLKMLPFEYVCIPKQEFSALEKYDQYNKYKNQEGFIYKLFNKEES